MSALVLWLNIPLMVLAFGLTAGIPLWLVLRRPDWHGAPETRSVPAYVAHRQPVRRQRPSRIMVPSIQH
jgi:hypothetical protein